MMLRLCLLAFLLASCGGRSKPAADTLVVALGAQPATLDPRFATDATGTRIGGLIFQSLVHVGPGFKPEGEAAERWTLKNHTYTFYLQPGLRFHNGRAVTPEDLLYSFSFYRSTKSPFSSSLAMIRDVRARDENGRIIVEVDLAQLSDKFLISDLPAIRILPKAEVESLGSSFAQKLIGTGPYRFVKIDLNDIRLEAVRAKIPHLVFKIIRDDFTRYQKLLKGEVDLAQGEIPPDRVKDFENRPGDFQVIRFPGLTMTYLLINFRDPLLARKTVRQALAQALERQDIIRFKLSGQAREATSILTPDNPYFNPDLKNIPPDLDSARAGIRKLGLVGRRLVLKTSNDPKAIDNGKVIANQLSRTGLDVDLESYEWGTFYADVKKGGFQLATMKWVGTVDPDIYQIAFHSHELPPGRNRGSYISPGLDALLDQAARTEDSKQRREIFLKVQAWVQDDFVILPLWYDEQVAILRKNVLNFHPSLPADYLPLAQVEKREL